MRQVPLVTCILLRYTKINRNLCLPAEGHTAKLYSLWDTFGWFWSRNNIALTLTVCIASFKPIGKLQRERFVSHVPKHLAGTDGRMDNSCKRRAYCLYRSFAIVHTKRGQCQASPTRERSACLAEVRRLGQTLRKFPKFPGELSMRKPCVTVTPSLRYHMTL